MKRNKKGFTLIEIIVVIVVLAVLLAVAVPSVLKYINEADSAKFMATARAINEEVNIDITKEMIKSNKNGEPFEEFVRKQMVKYSYGGAFGKDKDFLSANTLSEYGVFSVDIAFDGKNIGVKKSLWNYDETLSNHTITKVSIWFAKRNADGKLDSKDCKFIVTLLNKKMYYYDNIQEGYASQDKEEGIISTS